MQKKNPISHDIDAANSSRSGHFEGLVDLCKKEINFD
jgi:hypothetical protein